MVQGQVYASCESGHIVLYVHGLGGDAVDWLVVDMAWRSPLAAVSRHLLLPARRGMFTKGDRSASGWDSPASTMWTHPPSGRKKKKKKGKEKRRERKAGHQNRVLGRLHPLFSMESDLGLKKKETKGKKLMVWTYNSPC
jgi:hypothetical protein